MKERLTMKKQTKHVLLSVTRDELELIEKTMMRSISMEMLCSKEYIDSPLDKMMIRLSKILRG
tara:strand:- start:353 stop:541 length:189 start_codon:yes stop_codon:yes gene_type:complete